MAMVMGDKSHRLPSDAFKSLMVVAAMPVCWVAIAVCVAGNMVCDGVKAIDVNVGAITDSVAAMAVFVAGRGVA